MFAQESEEFILLRGKRCLITGGAGFIGSHLAKQLLQNHAEVTVVDSLEPNFGGNLANIRDIESDINFHVVDIRDSERFLPLVRGNDYIFNLAGQTSHVDSMSDPRTDLEINSAAQLDFLEAIRKFDEKPKIIFASTRQVYGRPRFLPVDESHPLSPVDVNGINKIAGESFHLLYQDVYGIPVSVLRLTNTYGPCMRIKDARQTFLGTWLMSIVSEEPFKVFGDGSQKRDFNFVDDVVRALILAALREASVGKIMNLGSGEVVSLLELAETLSKLRGSASYKLVEFPENRKSIDIGDYYGDWSHAKETLSWEPRIPLEEGLDRTLGFYEQNWRSYI